MYLETKIEQRQTQQLVLTPQMEQAIHMLQLPLMELRTFIEQQIIENPILEKIDASFDKKYDPEENIKLESRIDNLIKLNEDKIDSFGNQYDQEQEKRRRYRENIVTRVPTLYEHLMMQLSIFSSSNLQKTISQVIISNIDSNGYLRISLDEIAQDLEVSQEDVKKALSLIQSFSPVGVGARNLSECLMLQLKHKGREFSLAGKIVNMCLSDLEKRQFKRIAGKLEVSVDEVKDAFLEISLLEPKPGGSFGNERPMYITPDILLCYSGNGCRIEINNENIPAFRISPYYKRLLKNENTPEETKEFLKKKLNQALWLIKAVSRRQDTIKKIAECIIKIQEDFLDKGPDFIKPLTLKRVARIIGVNESTVSRTVANKYIHTPYGIFPLRRFFSGKTRQHNGEILSTESVKARIKELLHNENIHKLLSDEAIVKILNSEGISIARRTVTKYRKLLKIPSSNQRRFLCLQKT